MWGHVNLGYLLKLYTKDVVKYVLWFCLKMFYSMYMEECFWGTLHNSLQETSVDKTRITFCFPNHITIKQGNWKLWIYGSTRGLTVTTFCCIPEFRRVNVHILELKIGQKREKHETIWKWNPITEYICF